MIYWLFTDGRELLAGLLLPLLCLTALIPVAVTALSGAGMRRSGESRSVRSSGWKQVGRFLSYGITTLTITSLYPTLLGDLAVQQARGRQSASSLIQTLVGAPPNVNGVRLFLFGMLLLFLSSGWHRRAAQRHP
jgi:hypothetical protein